MLSKLINVLLQNFRQVFTVISKRIRHLVPLSVSVLILYISVLKLKAISESLPYAYDLLSVNHLLFLLHSYQCQSHRTIKIILKLPRETVSYSSTLLVATIELIREQSGIPNHCDTLTSFATTPKSRCLLRASVLAVSICVIFVVYRRLFVFQLNCTKTELLGVRRSYKSIESVIESVAHWPSLDFIGKIISESGSFDLQAVSGFFVVC